jgi:AcrR family transcriptional regulator
MRERHTDLTRQAILEAVAAEVVDGSLDELSFNRVAERSGVSRRTVFRHFPTREALIASFNQYVYDHIGLAPSASHGRPLGEVMREVFPGFDKNELLIRALTSTQAGRRLSHSGRPERVKMLDAAIKPHTTHLPAHDRTRALAVFAHLFTAAAWVRFKDDFDMDGVETGEAMAWAMDALLDDLKRRNQRAKEKQK